MRSDKRLSLPLFGSPVCLEAHKAFKWAETLQTAQHLLAVPAWSTPQAQLLYLFCSGHNYGIFLQADVCQSMSGRPRRWVSTTAGSDCVWSSHLYVSNQLSPPGGSMLNKPPVELVFVLKGSANRDPECSHFQNRGPLQLSSISPPAHNQHQLNLWHFDTHRRTL